MKQEKNRDAYSLAVLNLCTCEIRGEVMAGSNRPEKPGNSATRWLGNFVIWREILSFEGTNIAILKENLHFSSPGSREINVFSGPG